LVGVAPGLKAPPCWEFAGLALASPPSRLSGPFDGGLSWPIIGPFVGVEAPEFGPGVGLKAIGLIKALPWKSQKEIFDDHENQN
jgi:hypothetical protein